MILSRGPSSLENPAYLKAGAPAIAVAHHPPPTTKSWPGPLAKIYQPKQAHYGHN